MREDTDVAAIKAGLADGTIEGFVGGACAESTATLRMAAQILSEEGRPLGDGAISLVGRSPIEADGTFFANVTISGGPAPVRQYLPELIQLIWDRKINPGKVFDLTLPLEKAAEGYRAMDERTATKVLLTF